MRWIPAQETGVLFGSSHFVSDMGCFVGLSSHEISLSFWFSAINLAAKSSRKNLAAKI